MLENQKVVVVGGTSGIGLAVDKLVAEQGADVVVASRRPESIERAKQAIGKNITGYVVDVTEEQSVKTLFEQVGRFHHLVMTVGKPVTFAGFLESELAQVQQVFNVKFWGQYLCAKCAAPYIQQTGSMTLMAGSGGPGKGISALALTNAAVEEFSKCLAVELAPIRVNAVRPGMVDTPLWKEFSEPDRLAMYEQFGKKLLVGRIGTAEEIAQIYLQFMTNGFITGVSITVDGGMIFNR
jgi:NAD(P)-dependent dehydrogenase (short-subunit alcohol dehydrogenase family)